ncbi:MAG TPA: hypothetical protein V6C88_09940 [Chroococcidiopsis sp.]
MWRSGDVATWRCDHHSQVRQDQKEGDRLNVTNVLAITLSL